MARELGTERDHAAAEAPRGALPRGDAVSGTARILALQRAVGNQATARMLARQPRPRGAARPQPAALAGTLLGRLPEAQRRSLREITDQVASVPLASLAPPPGRQSGAGSATVTMSPAPEFGFTPQTPHVGRALNAVVAHLVNGVLAANTTSGILLDLRPYGGEHGVYRLTHVSAGGRTRYLVDFVQAVPTQPQPLLSITQASQFSQRRFAFLDPRGAMTTREPRLRQDEQDFRQAVARAVEMIPAGLLELVEGLRFRRQPRHATEPDAGGDYDHQTHVVTIYDPAMRQTIARFDDPGGGVAVNNLVRAVIHEIGHAIDQTRIRAAHVRLAAARRALDVGFSQYATRHPDGSVDYSGIPHARMREFNTLQAQAQRADTAYTRSRAETGSGYRARDTPGARTSFTGALAAGGATELTPYAGRARGEGKYAVESFAEAFSLYITEPETLRALRPALHGYFQALEQSPARAR